MSSLFETGLPEHELSRICEEVQVLSMQTGKFIREERLRVKKSDIEKKGVNDLVSYVDKQAEQKFIAGLKKIFPKAGFIAEESASLKKEQQFNLVIDPLDGTTNFLHGVPCFATSVALIEYDEPVVGVVYEINADECFYAWRQGGAWLNGEAIHVASATTLQDALVATGFPYHAQGWHEKYMALFSDVQQAAQGIRRPGSAATDIAYVACGRFDAYYEYGIHAWDVAAGIILLKEAGGVVTDFRGGEDFLFGERFVCGNEAVHAALLEKIKTHFN